MSQKNNLRMLGVVIAAVIGLCTWFGLTHTIAVLSPKGQIADKQRHLIIIATLLMLIVVIPVYVMMFMIAWKYREGNTKARYTPDWDHNNGLEFIWWAVPMAIIAALSVVTFKSSHDLDPFKALTSANPPITIQVVALQWKWLFIYPDQNIASVNYFKMPLNTPVNFEITADSPMNSFWIPQLGGQIYAMPGMSTELRLIADGPGSYRGVSANISGTGFAGMDFKAVSTSRVEYNQWISQVRRSGGQLNPDTYATLSSPSQNNPISTYSSARSGIYENVIAKYIVPPNFQTVPGLSPGYN